MQSRITGGRWTAVPNAIIDSGMSPQAITLLIYRLSKPETWSDNNKDFMRLLQCGKNKLAKTITELREHGYLEMEVLPQNEDGTFSGSVRLWHRTPKTGTPKMGYTGDGDTHSEGYHYSNTHLSNTYTPHVSRTREKKNDSEKHRPIPDPVNTPPHDKDFTAPAADVQTPITGHLAANPPSPDEIAMVMTGHLHDPDKAGDLAEQFFNNYQAQGWIRGNGVPISRWKYLAYDWCRRENEKKKTKQHDKRQQTGGSKYAPIISESAMAEANAIFDARAAAKAEYDPSYACFVRP